MLFLWEQKCFDTLNFECIELSQNKHVFRDGGSKFHGTTRTARARTSLSGRRDPTNGDVKPQDSGYGYVPVSSTATMPWKPGSLNTSHLRGEGETHPLSTLTENQVKQSEASTCLQATFHWQFAV